MCENKSEFIQNIFSLEDDSQAVLKELVQRVLPRAEDLDSSFAEGESALEDTHSAGRDEQTDKRLEEELIR